MEEIKKKIAECITNSLDTDISVDEIYNKIEIPKDKKNGDFAYPCFNLAKIVRNSPVNIANSIKENIELPAEISKVEVVNGYLNFYTNSSNVVSSVLDTICKEKEKYGFKNIGNNQNVCIDYSSPNIAKPFHLGHLRTTIIGRAISNLYKELGYNSISINYLGDWGRQFGLVIEGYKRFKDEYDISKDPLHSLSDMYVRANNLAKDDEKVMDMARENFKKLEDGNEEYIKLWKYFRELSLKEYNKTYELLGCKFDSYNGEAYYNDKMQEVIDILDKKGVLVESQGAKVVMLGKDEPPCIIVKSNGSTIYATRDLAAILDRSRTYDYVKSIYVTSYEQIHHFKQLFEVAKYIVDEKYTKELVHVPYGMVRLKTGKMSTREGTVIYLQDLINDAIKKAYNVLEEKNANLENKDKVAKQVGIGALVFNDLKTKSHSFFDSKSPLTSCWIVTNNRFTADAITFANCSGLQLLSWNYPENNCLKSKTDQNKLYPITCLTTLSLAEKEHLLQEELLLVKDILVQSSVLNTIGLSPNRIQNVLKEARELCGS